jgi:hypothetical protein
MGRDRYRGFQAYYVVSAGTVISNQVKGRWAKGWMKKCEKGVDDKRGLHHPYIERLCEQTSHF